MDLAIANAVDPDYCIAEWRNVLIVIWRGATTMPAVERLVELGGAFAAQRPGYYLLTVVEMNAPLPESSVRKRLATFMTDHGPHIKRSAVVFEGSGFRAAAVRGVVTGLTMLARTPYPHKVFAAAKEASNWLAGTDDAQLEPRALLDALAHLRTTLPEERKTGT